MLRTLLLSSALLVMISRCSAQSGQSEEMSDTIFPTPAAASYYATLDSLDCDTIYTIDSPKGYVLRSRQYSDPIMIAVQRKKGYSVFDAGSAAHLWGDFTFSRMDLDGKGNEELLINWSDRNGRSGWIDGWNEEGSGVIIWDLDKLQMLFEFQDHYVYNNWWNGVVTDSTGDWATNADGDFIMNDSLAGSISSCDNYTLTVSLKRITIQRSADCPYVDYETGAETPADTTLYVYELKKSGLVLKK